MIIIFANGTNIYMGGVEIFNEEFESLLKNNNIDYYRATSNSKNKIMNYSIRLIKSLFYIGKNYKSIDFIMIQYGNFIDILMLPFLKISNKPIKIIPHIGDTWKHIVNRNLKKITNNILNLCVDNVYIITDEQSKFIYHKNIKKIHTIINDKYIQKPKKQCQDGQYILFLGRVCKEKGVEDLLEVYSNLSKNINLPLLKIVGPIEDLYHKKIEEMISKNNLIDKVEILKPIYDISEKIDLIDQSLLMVYPSYADAFPLTVIEAFSRGVCCLATAISETKNFIEYDEFLFTPGNTEELEEKLQYVLLNKEVLQKKIDYMQIKSKKYAKGEILFDMNIIKQ